MNKRNKYNISGECGEGVLKKKRKLFCFEAFI